MKKLEQIINKCIWKQCQEESKSTTFSDVYKVGSEHSLYKSTECGGNDINCKYNTEKEKIAKLNLANKYEWFLRRFTKKE